MADDLQITPWLKAREIIALALREWFALAEDPEQALRYADAIQARLAHAEPPLAVFEIAWAYEGKPE